MGCGKSKRFAELDENAGGPAQQTHATQRMRRNTSAELHHVRFGGDGGVLKQAALYVLTRRDDADELAERAARVGAAAERAWTALQATQHAPEFEGRVSGFAYAEAFSSGD